MGGRAWDVISYKRCYVFFILFLEFSLGISKALVIPDFIICSGYFLSIKVVVSSFKRVSCVDVFEIIVQNLRAKEKGILIFVCFG